MKKLLITILIFATTFAMAQTEIVKPLTVGVKGGGSFNHFLGDIPVELDPKLYTGFTAGIFGNYKVSDNFSVQPEILYSRKGSNFEDFTYQIDFVDFNLEMYIKTDWIEIPVLGMYHINDNFTLFGGPYIGFYLNGTVVAKPSIFILGYEFEYDIIVMIISRI